MTAPANFDVDVVVPAHGRPQFLAETLQSIVDQTWAPTTVSVVSDDHSEPVRGIVASFALRYPAVRIGLIERDGVPGASGSRNTGATQGRAAIIAFLDDDDVWLPTYLEEAVSLFKTSEAEIVVTSFERFEGDSVLGMRSPRRQMTARDVYVLSPGATGSNIVCTRDGFQRVNGFDDQLPVANDRDFFLRLLASGSDYVVQDKPLVRVRRHGAGQLTRPSIARADGLMRLMRKHRRQYGFWASRSLRYAAARTRVSAETQPVAKAQWLFISVCNWSPTAERDIPLFGRGVIFR